MKRAAEKQLIKDDEDLDDEIEEVPNTGFKKADETVLSSRPMRALPRRSLAAAVSGAPPPSLPAPELASTGTGKFSGFSGFGSGATTTFSFSTPTVPPAAPKLSPAIPAASPAPFSFTSTNSSSQPSSLFGPPVASSASPATKAFASIVSSSSAPTEPAPTSTSTSDEDQSEVEYYKALRGLNVSFLSAVSKAIESDPFVDVAELLERYKSLRVSVKSDYDDKSKASQRFPASASSSTAFASKAPDPPKPVAPPTFTMPKPPSTFSGFNLSTPASSVATSTPVSGGFVPKLDLTSTSSLGSPFSFAPSKPAATETTSTNAPKSAFTFDSSSSSSSGTTSSPFAFGSAPASSGSSLFGKPSSNSVFSSTSAPSIFGSSSSTPSLFGARSDTTTDGDSAKEMEIDTTKDSEKKPLSSTSLFGSSGSTPTPFGSSTSGTTPEKEQEKDKSPAFSFGSASPSKTSFFSFGGSKAGSIGNPVGFGFGSPPKTPEGDAGSGPVTALPFSFAPLKPSAGSTPAEEKSEGPEGSSAEGTPAPEQPLLLATTSVHDQEGEGEEDEETVHEIRSKVYKMSKDKDGKAQWSDVGVGMLRLKKHKSTDARRVLLRNSSTGKITINFLVHSGMNATLADKVVSFIGHEQGASMPYRIRMKTTDQASALKSALDREITFVKGKSDA